MEKVSLKNIKIILLSITIMVVVVLILKLQIASTVSKTKPSQQTQQTQDSTSDNENVILDTKEEIEKDTEIIPRKSNSEVESGTRMKKAKKEREEEEEEEYFFPDEGEIDYNYTKKEKTKSDNEYEEPYIGDSQTKTETKTETPKIIREQPPVKQKTPQETFNFALIEMRKGRLNSAIYEFNNAIDISQDPNMTLKARRYLAECYERKGINSEAFDIYEYIYLETGKKSDLIEMSRVAQKTNRAFTAYNYVQDYIEQHPEEQESLSQYLKY